MCTFNSFYLQNYLQDFFHTPFTVHGPRSKWSSKLMCLFLDVRKIEQLSFSISKLLTS